MTITDPRTAKLEAAPIQGPPSGSNPLGGQSGRGTHVTAAAEGQTSPQARAALIPRADSPAGSKTAPPAKRLPVPIKSAPEGREDIPGGHAARGPHKSAAAGEQDPPARTIAVATPSPRASGLAEQDAWLAFAADVLDDLERVRIANENRLRTLTSHGEGGFGLDEQHPDVARLAALVQMLRDAEHQAELNLCRQVRAHPFGLWIARTKGIGEKQGARLLAATGDPYWNALHGRPRLVSELWSYCGYGDAAAQVRRHGQKDSWSATAKMRAYLAAESCMKQRDSPYRAVYDAVRERYAEAVHAAPCVRCGPAGRPAQTGSPLSAGHQNARALRAVAKEILRDLWREARDIHHDTGKAA